MLRLVSHTARGKKEVKESSIGFITPILKRYV